MRWIVDAMNVIGCRPDGWWKDRRAALTRLVDQLDRWADRGGHRVTVVLERPMSPPIKAAVIEVAHAPRGGTNSADDEIVQLVRDDEQPQEITVVTSDAGLARRIRDIGAAVYPAGGFRTMIESG